MKNSSNRYAYVDGSIDVNKTDEFSRGAAAAVLVRVEAGLVASLRIQTEFYSGFETVTNNRMELRAMEIAIKMMAAEDSFHLTSDSKYALNTVFGTNKAKANKELIEDIKHRIVDQKLQIISHHIHGHRGSFLNEAADYAARESVALQRNINARIVPRNTAYACLTCVNFPFCMNIDKRLTLGDFKSVLQSLMSDEWTRCALHTDYSPIERNHKRPQSTASGSIR